MSDARKNEPDFREIAAVWKRCGFRATRARVQLAVKRTGNCYGLTGEANPYIAPRVGMRVAAAYNPRWRGRIATLRGQGDPEAKIQFDDGGTAYLHQTAIFGYMVLAKKRKHEEQG